LTFLLDIRGKVHLIERRADDALDDFLACGQTAESIGFENPANFAWRSQAALALLALERRRCSTRPRSSTARAAGVRRRRSARRFASSVWSKEGWKERHLREAVDVLTSLTAQLEHAKALVELGAALGRRNARAEARELLRQGVELAHACGAPARAERSNDELAATGARRRKMLLTGIDSLTTSERRVAQLAAEELSNKEIAQALFVTVKTVEVHLSHVYRKLEIGSRHQLAKALVTEQSREPVPAAG
jgi:DNA-binding CsgD family transcriptional regulator